MAKRLKPLSEFEPGEKAGIFSIVYQHLEENNPLFTLTTLNENDLEYLYNVGHKLFKARQYEKALKVFIYISVLNKFDGRFLLGIGLCYLNLKKHPQALLAFLQLKQHFAETADPHINMHLAECFDAIRNTNGVIVSLKAAIKFYNDKPQYATFLKTAEEMLASHDHDEKDKSTKDQESS